MMGIRMLELRRILKPTGSIYLHCDHNASHYLKLIMDSVFGQQNFRNEIVWYYKGNSIAKRVFPAKHDTILFYATRDYVFHPILVPYAESTLRRYNHVDEDGKRYKISALRDGNKEKVYMKEGKLADSVWDIPVVRKKKERVGYPTQKPITLLERIIKASSNSGDLVLDPFCGCATTCVAAERLQRQWIGIDSQCKSGGIGKNASGTRRGTHRRRQPICTKSYPQNRHSKEVSPRSSRGYTTHNSVQYANHCRDVNVPSPTPRLPYTQTRTIWTTRRQMQRV